MLRYLGEVGEKTPLKSTIAMCAGYCGRTGIEVLRQNSLYSRVLAKKWIDVLKQNAHVFEGTNVDLDTVSKARSLEELDKLFSLKLLEYEDVEYENTSRPLSSASESYDLAFSQRVLRGSLQSSCFRENRNPNDALEFP